MNLTDTAKLLTVVASYDRRQVGEADVLAWHEALHDLDVGLCREAVAAHYRTSTEWLMPAHLRRLTAAARNDAAARRALEPTRPGDGRRPKPAWFDEAAAAFRRGDRAEGERIVAEGRRS